MTTLAKNIIEKFPTLLKHGSKLEYGLVTLLTAGGESIFSTAVFQCPCHLTWNLPYGMVFLLAPALGLFLLGYMLNTCTWCLTADCCRRDCSQWCTCESQSCKEILLDQRHHSGRSSHLSGCGVLGGTFYECSASGIAYLGRHLYLGGKDNCSTLMPKLPCLREPDPDQQDLLNTLCAHSQVGSWH